MKKLAITMGDPAGVGPELCLKLIQEYKAPELELIIYGNLSHLQRVGALLNLPTEGIKVKEHPISQVEEVLPGQVQDFCGQASVDFLRSAISDAMKGEIDGIVTCPINKAALEKAHIPFPGHTEILVKDSQTQTHAMMLTGGDLSCALVTTHIGIADVPAALTTERILEVARLTADLMSQKHKRTARLGMLGLNPHAGEGGLFGNKEEERIIDPAIIALAAEGVQAFGPLPPDTAFLPQMRAKVDAYICMYHDQGLIPLKTLYFDEGVNTTLGLPFIRTSVDHGTAFDIAWKGEAKVTSLRAAVDYARDLI